MKSNNSRQVAREESFYIEQPEVFVIGISSEVTVVESQDGKCHVKILAASKGALKTADLVEIVQVDRKLNVHMDIKSWGKNSAQPWDFKKQKFWGINFGDSRGLSVEIALPETASLGIKTISGDLQINQAVSDLKIESVSGDVIIGKNPTKECSIKTVSGDISTYTYSTCNYTLKSVSGDIEVYIAPDLNLEIDGKSISGDLNSEILLNGDQEGLENSNEVVKIITSTISGDFNLARN